MVVVLLTTHVTEPDKVYWGKTKCILKYLKVMSKLKPTLSVGDISVVKDWVDASYAVLKYYQGHTWAIMPLGKGVVYRLSPQKNKWDKIYI